VSQSAPQVSAALLLTSATLPAVPDIVMVPVEFGPGSGAAVVDAPAASWTR
jgi:hypothetical protein